MIVLAAAGFARDAAKVLGASGPCPVLVQYPSTYPDSETISSINRCQHMMFIFAVNKRFEDLQILNQMIGSAAANRRTVSRYSKTVEGQDIIPDLNMFLVSGATQPTTTVKDL